MENVTAVTCAIDNLAPPVESSQGWFRGIPWARVLVDGLLVAAIMLASSSLLTVR